MHVRSPGPPVVGVPGAIDSVICVVKSVKSRCPARLRTSTTGWMDHGTPAVPVAVWPPMFAPSGCVVKTTCVEPAPIVN